MPEPMPKNNEVLQQFYSTLERIVLFFAFDFTLDWRQPLIFFNRRQPQDEIAPKMDYSKLRKKCIHKPTVPPRSSPRKHVRGIIQSYDEPKVEARKKSSVEIVKNVTTKNNKKNVKKADKIQASVVETSKVETVTTPVTTVTEENDENFGSVENPENSENQNHDEDVEDSNPFTMLLQPIFNLWSNNDDIEEEKEKEEMTNFNKSVETDHSSISADSNNIIVDNSKTDQLQNNQPVSEMDILEEALNESPEKFIDTLIAMNNASSNSEGKNEAISGKSMTNESFGQQLLAEAGAQLMQDVSTSNKNVEYSTQKEEKIRNNFCINRTTTFHLEPANFPLKF